MHDRSDWPIAAALLQFPGKTRAGSSVQDAPPGEWASVLSQVVDAGFDYVDLTDSWLRLADLTPERRDEFADVVDGLGLRIPSLSITRRSVVDARSGEENLAYVHRTIDASAAVGVSVLSLGFHRELTDRQREQLWFWVTEGEADPVDDPEVRQAALDRIREVADHAAEVGMIVSLELYEDTFLGTAESAVRFITDVDRGNVGLNPDVGNLVRLHRPVEHWQDILEATLPYANYWQVKNYFRIEDPARGVYLSTPAPLELGFIDYRAAVRRALEVGFDGVICCEHYGGDGLSVSAGNMRYLRTLLPASRPASG